MDNNNKEKFHENYIEGRNAVLEAFRSGKTIDKLFVLDGCQDGPIKSITREARKHDAIINYVAKERLDQMSETGKHQGVIAVSAAYEYAEVSDILENAERKGEPPFIIILDGIEDPHNLGAIIRTANQAGAHGIIIPKRRAVGLTPTVAKTSAGAINYTPVAKVTNISNTIKELKEKKVEIRGDEIFVNAGAVPASEEDWGTEYDDLIISARVVRNVDEAIEHINRYNTSHSEAIVTNDYDNAQKFLNEIDAACVYVNASTRFSDGNEFGFGAEIGISTQKLHARGPMGLEALTSYKYIIYGSGQIRE